MESHHDLWDDDYWRTWATPNNRVDLLGHYFTYPLDKHREYFSMPKDNYGNFGWVRTKILIDKNLNVYYDGQKFINLRQLSRYYIPFDISCRKCGCCGFKHDENCQCLCIDNKPDKQADHHFYFNVKKGLYFADACDHELFEQSYYLTNTIYPGELKIGDVSFTDAAVHISFPYNSIKLPFIHSELPLTIDIDYLMLPIYRRQLYTTILCFKQYGNLPLPFLEGLFDCILK